MNIHMSMLIDAYDRLLADIRDLSGLPLGAPDEITYEWVLKEGPKLEKHCLAYIEGRELEQPVFPEWLKPLWDAFILKKDGRLLRLVRQALLFCYKAEYEPTHEQLKEAQASFEETDSSCGVWTSAFKGTVPTTLLRSARRIVGRVIYRIDWKEIEPNHGPGAVYPPCNPDEKTRFLTLYSSIQREYPYDQYLWSLPSFWEDIMVYERSGRIKESDDIIAKLVAVPKDSRGPRIICVHPKEAIWIQQGQRLKLEAAINASPITRGRINFTDQTVNGKLAMSSSSTGRLATLDLKEASDRISCELVRYLFGDYVYNIISCARANKVKLLDGRVMVLEKWAPMGNCLTFPVQSLVFFSVVQAGIRSRYGVSCDDIYVFGDDILFPSIYYDGVVAALASIGCVPNVAKTFYRGLFRESCGVDAYNGIDVTPLRMKKISVDTPQDALATVSLAKRLRLQKFERCSSLLYSYVSRRYGRLPLCNNPDASGLMEYVEHDLGWLMLNEPKLRFCNKTHQHRVPCRHVTGDTFIPGSGDWYHLHDSLRGISRKGNAISDIGTEYPVPYRTRLTYGWADCLWPVTKFNYFGTSQR
jgi:hypothetical protein